MDLDQLKVFLRARVAEIQREVDARGPQPEQGFWGVPANRAPASIQRPAEYAGGDRLAVACTQTGLSAAGQRKLVEAWCEALPTLDKVRVLWLTSRVPQELFDAACRMPALESLWIKWSGLESIDALQHAGRLRHLRLGSSPGVTDLARLERLPRLEWLELENLKRVTRLEPLAPLRRLKGLAFTGAEGQRNTVESLRPLSALEGLAWLHLGALHVRDGSLAPLAALDKLRWLGLGNFFEARELAALSRALPATQCAWLAPFATFHPSVFPCARCKQASRVMTSGKGSKLLCPACDAKKLAEVVSKWDALAGKGPP